MMKKEKAVKDHWCPLTGEIGPDDNLILRARELWGVKEIVEDNTYHVYRPSKAVIEKAQRIYNRWDEYNHDPMRIEMLEFNLSMALDPGRRKEARDESLQDIMRLFDRIDKSLQELRMLSYEIDESVKPVVIDVSEQEVFSILAIYEAGRVSKNPEWPLELLAIAKEYSPKAKEGKKFLIRQTVKSKKERTSRKGLTPAEQKIRNQKIITHYQKSKLSMNSFALRHMEKYGLKERRITDILKTAVGS